MILKEKPFRGNETIIQIVGREKRVEKEKKEKVKDDPDTQGSIGIKEKKRR